MDVIDAVLDSSYDAIFVVGSDGKVAAINQRAKEAFGLVGRGKYSHPAGRIAKGDIVLLSDSALGGDDGSLTPDDLKCIGIKGKSVKMGDALLAVGTYAGAGAEPVFKTFGQQELARGASLLTTAAGRKIRLSVGGYPGAARVQVDDEIYDLPYFVCIAQLVLLDGKTHKVKFWEERGFSARRESPGEILKGASFRAKSPNDEVEVKGNDYHTFFFGLMSDEFESYMDLMFSGKSQAMYGVPMEINGYIMIASLIPVAKDGKVEDVIVRFSNLERFREKLLERDAEIIKAEKRYRDLMAKERPCDAGKIDGDLTGPSSASSDVWMRVVKVSGLDCDVLITGESGTGKTHYAEMIDHLQKRSGPFITVDCACCTSDELDEKLFGKASENGDGKERPGCFEKAQGGTVFLDEIDGMPPDVQGRVFRVMRDRTVMRHGSTDEIPVDVRIIASSSSDLKEKVDSGEFRRDLYYRLKPFSVHIRPLRETPEDVVFFVNRFFEKYKEAYGAPEKRLSGEAFNKLLNYGWPENLRELENVIQSAVMFSDSDVIYSEEIDVDSSPETKNLHDQMGDCERLIIRRTLAKYGGSRTKAMEELGLSKTAFYNKMKELKIDG